jgi:predicted metal-dependent hydrolase
LPRESEEVGGETGSRTTPAAFERCLNRLIGFQRYFLNVNDRDRDWVDNLEARKRLISILPIAVAARQVTHGRLELLSPSRDRKLPPLDEA